MPFDNLQETLKAKTFGIPNWGLAAGGAVVVFLLAKRNSSSTPTEDSSALNDGTATVGIPDGSGNGGWPGVPGPDPVHPDPTVPQYPPVVPTPVTAPVTVPSQPPYVPPSYPAPTPAPAPAPTPTAPQAPSSSYTSWPYFTSGQTFYSFDVVNQTLCVKDTQTGALSYYGKTAVAGINPSFLSYFS